MCRLNGWVCSPPQKVRGTKQRPPGASGGLKKAAKEAKEAKEERPQGAGSFLVSEAKSRHLASGVSDLCMSDQCRCVGCSESAWRGIR